MASKDSTTGPSRYELYDDGEPAHRVVYVALDPDGEWSRSEFPEDLMTLDYDDQDRLIGMELIGDLARIANEGLLDAVVKAAETGDQLGQKVNP